MEEAQHTIPYVAYIAHICIEPKKLSSRVEYVMCSAMPQQGLFYDVITKIEIAAFYGGHVTFAVLAKQNIVYFF